VRRKGSSDNITLYDETLKDAVNAALRFRELVWQRRKKVIPINPKDRSLIVGVSGQPITQSTWQSAWKRFLNLAIEEKVITKEEWFGLHDMKRRGITDTPGGKSAKQEAGGHSDPRMLEVYDLSVPIVEASPD